MSTFLTWIWNLYHASCQSSVFFTTLDICDWNEELILQFYATLHITGNSEDVNSWVLDWMSENTHYKAPATELLRALPLSPPLEGACCVYNEPELTDHYMQVLMKPLKPGQTSRTKFLVKELMYVPRTVSHSDEDIESNQGPRLE